MFKFNAKAWDLHHTMIAIGAPLAAALVTYLSSKDPLTIIQALSSWDTARPMLLGALVVGLTTLLALAKQTFIVPTPPTGGAAAGGNPDIVNRSGSIPKAPGTFRMWSMRAAACVLGAALVTTAADCTPAQTAQIQKIENAVLQDIVSGKTLQQIEDDAASILAGQVGVDIAAIVNDAVSILVDAGVIPAQWLPRAKSYRSELKAELAARGAQ